MFVGTRLNGRLETAMKERRTKLGMNYTAIVREALARYFNFEVEARA